MARVKLPPKHQRDYKKSETRKQDLKGLYDFVNYILNSQDITPKYKKETIDWIIWKITEIDGKENTRYRSERSLLTKDKINHEHVVTKKFLVEKLFKFPQLYKEILDSAIGCIVTENEHKNKLSKIKNLEGWQRYKDANIKVIDMLTGKEADLEKLIILQKPILDSFK